MKQINRRKVTTIVTGVLVSGALVAAPVTGIAFAAKKSHKLTFVTTGAPEGGVKYKGPVTGTLGKGKQGGELHTPKSTYQFIYKNGTIYGTGNASILPNSTKVKGTWKITKGTGKYKGIKSVGKGTVNGDIASPVKFTFKITAKY